MKFLIVLLYLGSVVVSYMIGADFLFMLLTLPWSWVLTIFGFLIIHTVPGGWDAIVIGQFIGAIVNALLFLFLSSKKKQNREGT